MAVARYLIDGREVFADGSPVPGGYDAQTDAQRQLAEQGYPDMRVTKDGRWQNIGDEPASSYNDTHPAPADGGPTIFTEIPPELRAGMPLLLGLGIVGAILAARMRKR